MDLPSLQRELFAIARRDVPSERVPYAFEKRVMTQLRPAARPDHWAEWSRALWRAAAPCMAVMLLLSAWSFFPATGAAEDLPGPDLESTVMAAAEADFLPESSQ